MTNLKGPPLPRPDRPLLRVRGRFFFQIMPPCRQYIFKWFNISFAIVEIKKCANLQQIRSERDIPGSPGPLYADNA